jgi:peptidoglycan-associated lipoprotein
MMNQNSIRSTPTRGIRVVTLSALLTAAALLAGCSSSVPLNGAGGAPVESRTIGPGGAGAGTGGASESRVTPVDLTKGADDANGGGQNIVYFDFDSFVVKDEYRPIIDRFARALAADRKKHLQVEGHTDERGGREYNLALGQKRAEAVAKSLALHGAADTQVEAVSFGKERPAVQGSDEAAYAKNRRAELKYR